jgi:hypothetical protein
MKKSVGNRKTIMSDEVRHRIGKGLNLTFYAVLFNGCVSDAKVIMALIAVSISFFNHAVSNERKSSVMLFTIVRVTKREQILVIDKLAPFTFHSLS